MDKNKAREERTEALKRQLGAAYWPLYALLYPVASVAVFNKRNPLTGALIQLLLVANLIASLLKA
jgi:hypothetical protein